LALATPTQTKITVKCPKCGRVDEITLTSKIVSRAAKSAIGLATIMELHADHAIMIYVDKGGNVKSVRVYPLSHTIIEEKKNLIHVPISYLEKLERIDGFRVYIAQADITIEGFKEEVPSTKILLRGYEGETYVDLLPKEYEKPELKASWLKALSKAFASVGKKIPIACVWRSIATLDTVLDREAPLYANSIFEVLLLSRFLRIEVNDEELYLFKSYADSYMSRYPPQVTLDELLKHRGGMVFDLLEGKNPYTVYEYIELLLALRRRGVVSLVQQGE